MTQPRGSARITEADDAVRRLLATQWGDRPPAVIVNSPPGAGKTWAVERLGAQALNMGERCMVATQTNEQAFDLVRRLAEDFPRQLVWLFAKSDLELPAVLKRLEDRNLRVARKGAEIPTGPAIVVSNAAKWSWLMNDIQPFDLQVVDEGFQLHDYRFLQIAGLAERVIVVGDPGQIDPVVRADVERWRSEPSGPHIPCPRGLLERFGDAVTQIDFPISRRLPPGTVSIVQPAFYPRLPFRALAATEDRRLIVDVAGTTPIDAAIDIAARSSLALVELPPRITGESDEEMSATIVNMVERLMERNAEVEIDGARRRLDAPMVGVSCAHVSQVSAVKERLPAGLDDVFVETANRFQGLERPVMITHHPLSGRTDASAFHLDSGRLCVMMSRHSVVCFVVARAGILDILNRYAPSGDRVLGVDQDDEFFGWRAHIEVVAGLHRGSSVAVDIDAATRS